MRPWTLFVAAGTLAVCTLLGGCASGPSAVVDMQRALRECRDGRAVVADLLARHAEYQARLDQRKEELKRNIVLIEAERARGIDVREKEAALAREIGELHAQYLSFQKDLSAEEYRRAVPIQVRLQAALKQLKAARHIGQVSEATPVPPGDGRTIDLTSDLIRAVDAEPLMAPGR
jgi:Skp family chaperone for outer membrane proteins